MGPAATAAAIARRGSIQIPFGARSAREGAERGFGPRRAPEPGSEAEPRSGIRRKKGADRFRSAPKCLPCPTARKCLFDKQHLPIRREWPEFVRNHQLELVAD